MWEGLEPAGEADAASLAFPTVETSRVRATKSPPLKSHSPLLKALRPSLALL